MVGIYNMNGTLYARNSYSILFGKAKEQKISWEIILKYTFKKGRHFWESGTDWLRME